MRTFTHTTLADWDKLACQEARRWTEESQREQMEEIEEKTQTHTTTHLHIAKADLFCDMITALLTSDK